MLRACLCQCFCLEPSHRFTVALLFLLQVRASACQREFIKWTIKLPQSKVQFSLGHAIRKVLFWFCSACGAIRCICCENCRFVALALKPQTALTMSRNYGFNLSLCSGKMGYQYWWLIFFNYKSFFNWCALFISITEFTSAESFNPTDQLKRLPASLKLIIIKRKHKSVYSLVGSVCLQVWSSWNIYVPPSHTPPQWEVWSSFKHMSQGVIALPRSPDTLKEMIWCYMVERSALNLALWEVYTKTWCNHTLHAFRVKHHHL